MVAACTGFLHVQSPLVVASQPAVLLVMVAYVVMTGSVACSGAHFIGRGIATCSLGCSALRLECIDFKGLRLCHTMHLLLCP